MTSKTAISLALLLTTASCVRTPAPQPAPAEPAPVAPAAAAAASRAETVDDVLGRVIAAFGGEQKVAAVKMIREVGTSSAKTPQGDVAVEVESIEGGDGRVLRRMKTPMGDMVMVSTHDGGYMNTPMGMRDLPPSQRENLARELRRVPIFVLQRRGQEGYQFSLGGEEKGEAGTLSIVNVKAGELDARWWVDAAGHVVRISSAAAGLAGPAEQVTEFSDWRTVDGMQVPFARTVIMNGQPSGTTTVTIFEINPDVDPTLFTRLEKN